jgi:hydroxyacylglutathione hydrolase
VAGEKQMPKPRNILFRVASAFVKTAPVQVDVVLKDKDKLGQLTVIHTPGHTPGSIAMLDETRKVLFVGDTLRFDGEKITRGPEKYSLDPAKAKESIEKIAMLDFDVMLPGHGEVLQPNASEAVKKFTESTK